MTTPSSPGSFFANQVRIETTISSPEPGASKLIEEGRNGQKQGRLKSTVAAEGFANRIKGIQKGMAIPQHLFAIPAVARVPSPSLGTSVPITTRTDLKGKGRQISTEPTQLDNFKTQNFESGSGQMEESRASVEEEQEREKQRNTIKSLLKMDEGQDQNFNGKRSNSETVDHDNEPSKRFKSEERGLSEILQDVGQGLDELIREDIMAEHEAEEDADVETMLRGSQKPRSEAGEPPQPATMEMEGIISKKIVKEVTPAPNEPTLDTAATGLQSNERIQESEPPVGKGLEVELAKVAKKRSTSKKPSPLPIETAVQEKESIPDVEKVESKAKKVVEKKVVKKKVEKKITKPVQPIEELREETVDEPLENVEELPVKKSVEKELVKKKGVKKVVKPIEDSIRETVDEPMEDLQAPPVKKPVEKKLVKKKVVKKIVEPIEDPIRESVDEPMDDVEQALPAKKVAKKTTKKTTKKMVEDEVEPKKLTKAQQKKLDAISALQVIESSKTKVNAPKKVVKKSATVTKPEQVKSNPIEVESEPLKQQGDKKKKKVKVSTKKSEPSPEPEEEIEETEIQDGRTFDLERLDGSSGPLNPIDILSIATAEILEDQLERIPPGATLNSMIEFAQRVRHTFLVESAELVTLNALHKELNAAKSKLKALKEQQEK